MRRLLATLLLLTACHADGPLGPLDVTAWAAAKARWQAAGVTHYRYESTMGCFCPGEVVVPITVEYRNGTLVEARYADGRTVLPSYAASRPPIDTLFQHILEQQSDFVERVEASYDPQYGYPRSLNVIAKSTIADGGFSRAITRFEVLP